MFSNDGSLDMKPATLQDRGSLHQHIKTLFRNQTADTKCAQTIVFFTRIRCAYQQVSEFRVKPVIYAANVSVWCNLEQVFTVGVRAGDYETRRAHLASQQPGRIQRTAVDVFRVGRERERQAGDDRYEPCDCCRAVTE